VRSRVAIALGSNLGERASHLEFALERLGTFVTDLRASTFVETAPVGVPAQPDFLNAACVGTTTVGPEDLLERLLALEGERGRVRKFPHAPRTLDLDLILYADLVLDTPTLHLPHPRFRERRFVLEPLAEIGPELVDPVSRRTVRELFDALG
jgi:2-amino-4-hydroxy-6-hydroxymethyldihydropteridine diphosphokinase